MNRRHCRRFGEHHEGACSCEMGNLYRYAEPIVLLAIAQLGKAYGYQIAQESAGMAVTHAGLDSGVIYRTLRRLEMAGRVSSSWDTSGAGPARRVYVLTESGAEHLSEWAQVLEDVVASLQTLVKECARAARQSANRPAARSARPPSLGRASRSAV